MTGPLNVDQPKKKKKRNKLNSNLVNTQKSGRLEDREPLNLYCEKVSLWPICEN